MAMRRLVIIFAALSMLASGSRKDAYIISTGDNMTYNAGTNLDEFQSARKRVTGRYVWVRRGGREYVIRDETTILRAEGLVSPGMALAPQQAEISREESRLDREADRLEDKDERLKPAEEKRLAELRDRLRVIERREKELDEKQEELEREAERAFWPLVDGAIRAGL